MVSTILVGIYVAVVLYKCYQWMIWKPEKFPPGPPRIPLVGSYLFMLMINYRHLHKAVQFLCKIYKTNILGMYIGPFFTIVANDHKSVKELLNRQEFDGRPDLFLARIREPDYKLKGIFFTDTIKWKDQRRFMLRHLRDAGFGRRDKEYELELQDELACFIDLLRNGPNYDHEQYLFKGDAVLWPDVIFGSLGNSFMKTACGDRIPRSEQAIFFNVGRSVIKFQQNADDYGRLMSQLPFIRHFAPNLSGFKPVRDGNLEVHSYIKSIVDREIKSYNENNTRHCIDMYIKEMDDPKRLDDAANNFLYDNLNMLLTDLIIPAQGAIGQQLAFLFQRLVKYPEIQKRIQDEIEQFVGTGRLPNLDDRINLHYTEATIREILRHETLVPSAIPHLALEATEYMGYHVPKGTVLVAGLDSFHQSDAAWGDANAFRPDRFLDENGNFSIKLDISLPFGAGKRLCAGETFSRNLMFLYTSGILQNFTIKKSATEEFNDECKNMTGLFRYIDGDLCVKFEPR